jgi:hypothetical protein
VACAPNTWRENQHVTVGRWQKNKSYARNGRILRHESHSHQFIHVGWIRAKLRLNFHFNPANTYIEVNLTTFKPKTSQLSADDSFFFFYLRYDYKIINKESNFINSINLIYL